MVNRRSTLPRSMAMPHQTNKKCSLVHPRLISGKGCASVRRFQYSQLLEQALCPRSSWYRCRCFGPLSVTRLLLLMNTIATRSSPRVLVCNDMWMVDEMNIKTVISITNISPHLTSFWSLLHLNRWHRVLPLPASSNSGDVSSWRCWVPLRRMCLGTQPWRHLWTPASW